jgi:hypothetical protein
MTYFGKMQDASGEVGYISNLPVNELLNGGAQSGPVSVNDLMAYANVKHRLGTDTLEAVYRLNELSSNHFRTEGEYLIAVGRNGASASKVPNATSTLSPRVFGFVWRNTQPDAGLVFDITKSIEWRAETSSGLTQTPVQTGGPSLVPYINRSVDEHKARTGVSIWERVRSFGQSMESKLSQIAFTGVGQKVLQQGERFLLRQGAGFLQNAMQAAPLLLM